MNPDKNCLGERWGGLDILKSICAFFVVCIHCAPAGGGMRMRLIELRFRASL